MYTYTDRHTRMNARKRAEAFRKVRKLVVSVLGALILLSLLSVVASKYRIIIQSPIYLERVEEAPIVVEPTVIPTPIATKSAEIKHAPFLGSDVRKVIFPCISIDDRVRQNY
jgi:hypothetical protein